MRFRNDPLVSIGIFHLAIQFQTLNTCRAVTRSTVVPQLILIYYQYAAFEYILIIYDHQSTNSLSAGLFDL